MNHGEDGTPSAWKSEKRANIRWQSVLRGRESLGRRFHSGFHSGQAIVGLKPIRIVGARNVIEATAR